MSDYMNSLLALIAKRAAANGQVDAWVGEGIFTVEEKSVLTEEISKAFQLEKSQLLVPLSQQSNQRNQSQAPAAVAATEPVQVASDSSGACSQSAYQTVMNDNFGAAIADNNIVINNAPLITPSTPAPSTSHIPNMVSSPLTTTTFSSSTLHESRAKRPRHSRVIFDPSNEYSIQQENEHTIVSQLRAETSAVTHANLVAYNELSQYGWNKKWGFGAHKDQIVIINPRGRAYRKKDNPVLGEDFFVDAPEALAYARSLQSES